jgi:hypothetical protein
MKPAAQPYDRSLDPLIAAGRVSIPRDHPAYTGGSQPACRLAAPRRSITAATIAGLLSIAALSGGAAHYMLRIAPPMSEGAAASPAKASGTPDWHPMAALMEVPPAAEATPGPEIAPATETAPPPAATKQRRKRSIKAARLLSLAQKQKPAMPEVATVAVAPPVEISPVPIPIAPPLEPIMRTPKADR